MFPSKHFLYGGIFSLSLYLLFPQINFFSFLVIWFSSVLIDVDHYLYYVCLNKNLSLKKSYKWFRSFEKKFEEIPNKKDFFCGVYFLHGAEVAILLLALAYFNNLFLFIFIGFIFHQMLDLIDISIKGARYDKVISSFYSLFRGRNKKEGIY